MKIWFVGGGALGLLFTGKLALMDQTAVRLITRTEEQTERIRAEGLLLEEEGSKHRIHVESMPFVRPMEGQTPPDWIGLMVKQSQIDEPMVKYVKRLMDQGTGSKLLCFQNGVGHVEKIAEAGIPRSRIYVAVTTEGARKDGANRVAHTGRGATSIGCAETGNMDREELEVLRKVFLQAGLECVIDEKIDEVMYKKLLINSIINPLTAILNIRNGELLESEYSMNLMKALFAEACGVLEMEAASITEALWENVLEVCKKTAANSSSMLQDIRACRRTEIDWITGSVIALAAKQGKRVPAHETVYYLVKRLEAKNEANAVH